MCLDSVISTNKDELGHIKRGWKIVRIRPGELNHWYPLYFYRDWSFGFDCWLEDWCAVDIYPTYPSYRSDEVYPGGFHVYLDKSHDLILNCDMYKLVEVEVDAVVALGEQAGDKVAVCRRIKVKKPVLDGSDEHS